MSQSTHLRKYGVQTTVDFELYEVDGVDLRVDWVPAAADCEVMKDEGASTQCTNTATDEGSTYSVVLTATEMQAARLVLKIVDAATKVFLDKVVILETYGHASAMHAMDFDEADGTQFVEAGGTGDHLTAIPATVDWLDGGRLDLLLDAIKVPTDKMVFTTANQLDVDWVNAARTLTAATNITSDASAINVTSGVVDTVTLVTTVTTVTNQLTTAAIATGVWQDTTSGDFTTASSIGKSLYTAGVVPGGTNGLFIAGTNAATVVTTSFTTTFTGNLTGSVDSVSGDTKQTADHTAGIAAIPTTMVGTDNAFLAASAPTNFSSTVISAGGAVDSLVQGFINNTIAETTADNIANNFEVVFDNANSTTTSIIDDIENVKVTVEAIPTTAMRGTDSVVLAGPTKTEMDTAHALLATPAQVNTQVDVALNTAIPASPTADSINERVKSMDLGILLGTVDTVTNSHTPTTTVFQADDITEATANHFIGRIVTFTSGALLNQSTDITDYAAVGGIGQFTVTETTEAPANDDEFKIT